MKAHTEDQCTTQKSLKKLFVLLLSTTKFLFLFLKTNMESNWRSGEQVQITPPIISVSGNSVLQNVIINADSNVWKQRVNIESEEHTDNTNLVQANNTSVEVSQETQNKIVKEVYHTFLRNGRAKLRKAFRIKL